MRTQNHPNPAMGRDSFHYYPEEYRLQVLARAMDAYVRQQFTIGVSQGDFAGRNVKLVANGSFNSEGEGDMVCGLAMPSRIVLVDYNRSTVSDL